MRNKNITVIRRPKPVQIAGGKPIEELPPQREQQATQQMLALPAPSISEPQSVGTIAEWLLEHRKKIAESSGSTRVLGFDLSKPVAVREVPYALLSYVAFQFIMPIVCILREPDNYRVWQTIVTKENLWDLHEADALVDYYDAIKSEYATYFIYFPYTDEKSRISTR